MDKNPIDRNKAAEIFLRNLINRAYEQVVRGTISVLSEGPPGRKPSLDRVLRAKWYNSLDSESQEHVKAIIGEVADAAVFGSLVLLDNLTGGYPLPDHLSDFAIYIQAYENEEARKEDLPELSVRVNPSGAGYEDLHDIFRSMLDKRTT